MAARQRAVAALPTLMQALRKEAPPQRHRLPSLRRAFSIYDHINLIDIYPKTSSASKNRIDDSGLKINGVKYEGSLICMGNFVMSWTLKKFSDITAERLCSHYQEAGVFALATWTLHATLAVRMPRGNIIH